MTTETIHLTMSVDRDDLGRAVSATVKIRRESRGLTRRPPTARSSSLARRLPSLARNLPSLAKML